MPGTRLGILNILSLIHTIQYNSYKPKFIQESCKEDFVLMQETWVRSLAWEDPLEKGKDIHSSNPAWRIPRTV